MDDNRKNQLIQKLCLKTTYDLKFELLPFVSNNSEAKFLLENLPDVFVEKQKPQKLITLVEMLDKNVQEKLYKKFMPDDDLNSNIPMDISNIEEQDKYISSKKEKSPRQKKKIFISVSIVILFMGIGIAFWGQIKDLNIAVGVGWFLAGLAASLISGVVINTLWDEMKRSAAWRMLEKAVYEDWSKFSKVRYKQDVKITFNIDKGKVIVTTEHEYFYKVSELKELDKNYYGISIFSDFQPTFLKYDDHEDERFHFDTIKINGDEVLWSDVKGHPQLRKDLCNKKNGKLSYIRERLNLPHEGELRVFFKICGEYALQDRMVWTFQEISENAIIRVNKACMQNNADFYISINHPLVDKILDSVENVKIVNRETGKIAFEKSQTQIRVDYNILPYQGFEITWDISER